MQKRKDKACKINRTNIITEKKQIFRIGLGKQVIPVKIGGDLGTHWETAQKSGKNCVDSMSV